MCSLFEQYRTFLSVDLKAIQCNGLIARKTFDGQQIMCVLKADAYGHGIEGVLPAYEHFADAYAVATDDNHCGYDENGVVGPGDNTLGGYICISMPEITYDNFIDAFKNSIKK